VRPETARSLSGNEEAETILDNLERNQMFVTGSGGPRPVYRYHPLLRGFLQTEAERTLTPEALHVIKGETAAILAREGDLATAARLYAETRRWSALARLIVENAPTLWEQGRVEPLCQWLDRLPPDRVEREPWLAYWHGHASLLFEPRQAGRHFETAFHAFDERGDATGVCLSLTGIFDSIMYGNDSLGDVPRWLDVMERLRQRGEPCPAPEAALRLEFTAFNMGFLACPEQTDTDGWRARARRLERIVSAIPDDTVRCMSASHLAMYYTWHPQPARLRLLADDLYKYAVSEETPPLARLIAYLVEITRRWVTADTGGTDAVIAEALRMMETRGVHVGRLWLLSAAIFYHLTRGAVQTAETLLQRFHAHVRPGFRNEQAHYHLLAAWLALLRQDAELAHQHAETACELVRPLHTPHFELLSRAVHCLTLARLARFDAARREIADTRALAATIHARHVGVFHLGLLEAWIARRQGRREDALRRLRPALACGREMALRVSPGMDRRLLAEMCALALENGIETAYVRRLIQWNALLPAPGMRLPPAWPFAVHIRALGGFELRVQGRRVPLLPAHNKPLKLLRVLLALGGRDVADSRIEDILWPDAEGAAAHRALITNLQRLRRLLGGNHVVRHRNGRLGLDPCHCWVDIWVLEQGPDGDGPEALIRLLKLYRGDFLRDEEDAWWLLERREHLRAEILRHHGRLQEHLADAGRWRDLIEWCRRGLEIDEVHEPFYQGLMHAHRQLGRYGEAARVYHRCRRKLRDRLDTSPGPETQALFESLLSR